MEFVIEYIQRKMVVGSEDLTGTIDDAANAAILGLETHRASVASIKDAETGKELKAVVQK